MAVTSTELVPPSSSHLTARTEGPSLELQLRAAPENVAGTQLLGTDEEEPNLQPTAISISKAKGAVVIMSASSMVFMNSILSGMLTVGLPTIAKDIRIPEGLMLWPVSVYGLTCGCTLLLSGSIADVIGSRKVFLTGCFLLSAFTLGCGLAKTAIQLIMFRAISGIAMSLCLPSAVSIITTAFPTGKRRNIAFACLGAAQPVGFSVGVALGGVLVDTIGWRYGYYLFTGINALFFLTAIWGVPADTRKTGQSTWKRLTYEIDWIGTVLISASLGLFSYTFAIMSAGPKSIVTPTNLALLILAVLLLPLFIFWINHREKANKPTLIPPSLFHSTPTHPHRTRNFSALCVSIFLTWAVFNAYQYFTTLYFQRLQHLSPLETSARFAPMIVAGALTNIATGLVVNRVPADILCVCAASASAIAPLLMAVARPGWSYWAAAFVATALIPVSADTLFTVANLVVTGIFPKKTHGLAGGVFNTLAQIGMAVGLAVMGVVSGAVSGTGDGSASEGNEGGAEYELALLKGYQATYWTSFAASVVIVALSWWGLKSIGKVGVKRD
ncbi:hypothetical protein AJ79_01681 [Helicocarpus griseus UAMH5409]|uniref:Major facilitator superfamily (MFS) profile domain-containing protein n=1 Tax=Helicocarpus griseus UAMH5409 TaxID=1447875 RepID=A0A2B7Y5U4_9EURO|nr:hypothetical protein AJ79_01681 [Helicocarpus griseus UAMH5409]